MQACLWGTRDTEMNKMTASFPLGLVWSKRQKITNVIKKMEKLEPSYATDGNVEWSSRFGKKKKFISSSRD